MSFVASSFGFAASGTVALVNAGASGQRIVLSVITPAATAITNIYKRFTTTDAGLTLVDTYIAQGRKLWLYDKIGDAGEPGQYEVHFTPATPGGTDRVVCSCARFDTSGDPVRAYGFVDSASGTSLTLPSVQVANGDDLYAFVWTNPAVAAGALRSQSPLTASGSALSSGLSAYAEDSWQVWQSSAPTGTRQYAVVSGSHEGAVGVAMLIGESAPVGGWGVGAIRMGAN